MPFLIIPAITGLVGWIVGSTVNNATEPAVVVSPSGTIPASSGLPTAAKIGLYVAGGIAAVYVAKKLIAKI